MEWVKPEHPYTAISDKSEVHANPVEVHNAALRRHCFADRRHQNLYAKATHRIQRAVTVQQLIHNWVRPNSQLGTIPLGVREGNAPCYGNRVC